MSPTKPSEADEAAFMNSLLGDDSFWNPVLTPNTSPAKSKPTILPKTPLNRQRVNTKCQRPFEVPIQMACTEMPSSSRVFSAGDVDMDLLLDGADSWDLTLDSDPFTPQKPSPKKIKKVRHNDVS